MAKKEGEIGGGGDDCGGVSADRPYPSPARPRSPVRRSSGRSRDSRRRPRSASPALRSPSPPPRCRGHQTPVWGPPMCASPARQTLSPLARSPVMAKKEGETGGGGGGVRFDVDKIITGVSVRVSADRPYASPTRPRSPVRPSSGRLRDSRRSSPSSSPRCRGHQGPPMCASPARQSCSPLSSKQPSPARRLPICASPQHQSFRNKRLKEYAGNEASDRGKLTGKKRQCAPNQRLKGYSGNEASDSGILTAKKRPSSTADLIWMNAETSCGRTLGNLSVDLDSGTVSAKRVSGRKCNLANSCGNVNEGERISQLPNQPPSKPISGCPISGLNHKIFLCPCEQSRSEPVQRAVVRNRVIPGSNEDANFVIPKSCHTLNGMINAVTLSHSKRICFNGNLSRENFWETEEGEVKLTGIQPQPFTSAAAKLDNSKVADIIELDLFADIDIPPSIAELLKLLRTGELRDEDAMCRNISLMSESERMSLFTWLLKSLMELQDKDPTAYKDITDAMEARSHCWENWWKSVLLNEHLLKIWNYIDPATGEKIYYPPTVKGLIRFARNSVEHLPQHAYDRTTQASLYYLFEIDHIISGTFKGLFEALQSAMSSAGKTCKW